MALWPAGYARPVVVVVDGGYAPTGDTLVQNIRARYRTDVVDLAIFDPRRTPITSTADARRRAAHRDGDVAAPARSPRLTPMKTPGIGRGAGPPSGGGSPTARLSWSLSRASPRSDGMVQVLGPTCSTTRPAARTGATGHGLWPSHPVCWPRHRKSAVAHAPAALLLIGGDSSPTMTAGTSPAQQHKRHHPGSPG